MNDSYTGWVKLKGTGGAGSAVFITFDGQLIHRQVSTATPAGKTFHVREHS
jgi:hypothetical protein